MTSTLQDLTPRHGFATALLAAVATVGLLVDALVPAPHRYGRPKRHPVSAQLPTTCPATPIPLTPMPPVIPAVPPKPVPPGGV